MLRWTLVGGALGAATGALTAKVVGVGCDLGLAIPCDLHQQEREMLIGMTLYGTAVGAVLGSTAGLIRRCHSSRSDTFEPIPQR
ncbi:MAG: hypothetical protein IPP90_01705 [Gemmatimonadaceae bacterium]|nr:hypothetical protein [Gemmatimonadaceae bacterium]